MRSHHLIDRREFLEAAAASLAVTSAHASSARESWAWQTDAARAQPGSLRALASSKGLICGAALDYNWLGDTGLMAAVTKDCNTISMATGFSWRRTQPLSSGPLDFHEAEGVYAAARKGGQLVRGHNLIWSDPSLPHWILALEDQLSSAAAAKMMTQHVRSNMAYWKDRLISQEVVNEPIDSAGMQNTLWYRKLGVQYVDMAFQAAREADPHCLRIINQDWIESNARECEMRRSQLLRLIEGALKRGAPIQALGVEGHLDSAYPFSENVWRRFVDEIVGMGLKIVITEFDVDDRALSGSLPERDTQSAALIEPFLSVTLSYPQCLGIVSQSWSDRYNWMEHVGKRRSDGLPIRSGPVDVHYQPKPMHSAIEAALRGAPGRRQP